MWAIQNNCIIDGVNHRLLFMPTCLLKTYLEMRVISKWWCEIYHEAKLLSRKHIRMVRQHKCSCISFCKDTNNVLLMRDSNRSCIYEYLISMLPASSFDKLVATQFYRLTQIRRGRARYDSCTALMWLRLENSCIIWFCSTDADG